METSLFALCVLVFIIVDPIGSIPPMVNLIKRFPVRKQILIIARESVIALLIGLFFQYFGEYFLSLLGVEGYALRLASGIIIMIIAMQMLFASSSFEEDAIQSNQEPFVFPIATPLLSGPGLLAVLMIEGRVQDPLRLSTAVLLAWIPIFIILLLAPFLQRVLGRSGLVAFERVMGILVALVAMEMIVKGSETLIQKISG